MADGKKIVCHDCGTINRVPDDKLGANPRCGSCGGALNPASVSELDARTYERSAKKDDVPLVVDFWAPWCGPCKMMAPEFKKAAASMGPGVRFAKVNTEDYPQVSMKNGIRGIPTMIVYQNGKEVARQSGAMRADGIEAFIRSNVKV